MHANFLSKAYWTYNSDDIFQNESNNKPLPFLKYIFNRSTAHSDMMC